jgi:hypothetical protein
MSPVSEAGVDEPEDEELTPLREVSPREGMLGAVGEIVEDLQAALDQFSAIAETLRARSDGSADGGSDAGVVGAL